MTQAILKGNDMNINRFSFIWRFIFYTYQKDDYVVCLKIIQYVAHGNLHTLGELCPGTL